MGKEIWEALAWLKEMKKRGLTQFTIEWLRIRRFPVPKGAYLMALRARNMIHKIGMRSYTRKGWRKTNRVIWEITG